MRARGIDRFSSQRAPRPEIGTGTDLRPGAPLYDARLEHDACGVGFVAETRVPASPRVIPLALRVLGGLTHRGAIAADAQTGDGAGIAIPLSPSLLDHITAGARLDGDAIARAAVGMVFLPQAGDGRADGRRLVEVSLEGEGLAVAGWRDVPIDSSVLGPTAAESCPVIEQVIVARPPRTTALRFERQLFLARRAIEHGARGSTRLRDLHVASLSARTVVYKGLFVGDELGRFYLDLAGDAPSVPYATFHQRYSTNTHPSWRLAQPFRYLAHNGEINTVRGNRDAMAGRAAALGGGSFGRRLGAQAAAGWPLLDPDGSDSASLDEALELLVCAGWPVGAALMALLPEAPGLRSEPLPGLVEWQGEAAARVEPWDGPAAIVFGDGTRVGAVLDRNGLRPAAWELHRDGLMILASEAGTIDVPAGEVVRRGRLDPGAVLLVDTRAGRILEDREAKLAVLGAGFPATPEQPSATPASPAVPKLPRAVFASPLATDLPFSEPTAALRRRALLGLDAEQLRMVARVMASTGREPTWSMGDDTPLAVLARRRRSAAGYLRQSFAQVTNPPIDPERERVVMSLALPVGRRPDLLDPIMPGARPVATMVGEPVLREADWLALIAAAASSRPVVHLDATWPPAAGGPGLARALERLGSRARSAARAGAGLVVVSDRAAGQSRLPVPTVLAVGAVHAALSRTGLRSRCDVVVEAGDAWDVHGVAMLVAAGASAVHPWLALELAAELAGSRGHEDLSAEAAVARFVDALDHGLRKVIARMGISTLASYRGSQLFEVVGLAAALADRCFPAAPRFEGTVGAEQLGNEIADRRRTAYGPATPHPLADPGFVRYRGDGEFHAFSPAVVKATQALASLPLPGDGPGAQLEAAAEERAVDERLDAYRAAVDRSRPAMIRDLLRPRPAARAVLLRTVEAADLIAQRFVSSAMSLGSLSPEAHQALAIGMRRLGGAANTGEGGEDPAWYEPRPDGELHEAAIKQVASARFGVTAEYLARAEQLEIKMAQGSKPGEGGQLPGAKATPLIAALRRGQPGMTMISPPPHHDIYSIEDLAQLIADLRAINPTARIGVKLVATRGVGTIAAGVAKAHADYVMISGHSGGTGASPLGSIKHVGLPWELGLAEAHQVLVHQGLRDRVALRVDGGLQTGRDVLIAALLGAEEFGFGTAALVALGCDMARQCHLDTCPTGIATQREDLRAKFTGTPDQVVSFFTSLAEDVRRELATVGLHSLEEAVGRTDRLEAVADSDVDLGSLLASPAWIVPAGRRGRTPRVVGRTATPPAASALDERLTASALGQLRVGRAAVVAAATTTRERALGARLSGEIARDPGLRAAAGRDRAGKDRAGGPIAELVLTGAAGQSLGAFLAGDLRIHLLGVANDFVGKGLSGGEILVRPPSDAPGDAEDQVIAGNACLYGATGGRLHLVGRAGIRFAVRNSGASAVVEGVGAHGCEYMTGGTVVIIGPIGRNFGAGMTGGRAWIHDPSGTAVDRIHSPSVTATRLSGMEERPDLPAMETELRALVNGQAQLRSARAADLLASWPAARDDFWLVEPIAPTAPAARR